MSSGIITRDEEYSTRKRFIRSITKIETSQLLMVYKSSISSAKQLNMFQDVNKHTVPRLEGKGSQHPDSHGQN